MLQDVLNQLGSGIVLWIPAEDFFFVARRVGKEDKVANHVQQASRLKHALNQAVQRVDAVDFDQITTVGIPPRVEKLVRCKKGSGFVVDTIADHAKRVVFEQFRNVSPVTDGELLEGFMNRRIFADRTFEFGYDQRQTVDGQNAVGDAFLAANNF